MKRSPIVHFNSYFRIDGSIHIIIHVLSVFFCINLFCLGANAEDNFFMEPYVGFSKLEVLDSSTTYKDISDNYIIGVRSGVRLNKLFLLGADYHAGGPYQFGMVINRGSWTTKSLGIIFGLDYKVIRFWYSYYPQSRIDDTFNNYSLTGTGQKFGFGLELNQKIRVNLEIMWYAMTKRLYPYLEQDFSQFVPKETNAYLSVPVEF
ncbi:MAG: hypothetical protein J0M15_09195 [Deltaproteobacteria bacterium]|nr:hypothetical protein [Deltaproteobacteria bacterium]